MMTTAALALTFVACGDDDASAAVRICDGEDHDGDGTVDDQQPPCKPCLLEQVTSMSANAQRSAIAAVADRVAIAYEDGPDSTGEVKLVLVARGDAGRPMPSTVAPAPAGAPTAVANRGDVWLAWQDGRDGAYEIYAAQYGPDGMRKSGPTRVSTTMDPSVAPKLASASATLGLVWQEEGARTRVLLAVIGSSGVRGPFTVDGGTMGNASEPAITAVGDRFLIAWSDERHGDREIYARSADAQGALGEEARVTNQDGFSSSPALAPHGDGAGLVWLDGRNRSDGEVFFVDVDARGKPRGEPTRVTSTDGGVYLPAAAAGSGAFFFVWNDLRGETDEIYTATVDDAGKLRGDPVRLSGMTVASGYPSVVFDGSGFAVSFYDGRLGSNELYYARVGTNGYCREAAPTTR